MENSEKERNSLERYTFIILAVIIMCQLLVIVKFGFLKESYHVDEIYTFGLSNSYYKPFITWNEEFNSWHDTEFYLNYLTVQSDERFSYDSVYYNQVNDVHPPLYYFGIHTLCSFFPNIFSKWIGIIFNMVFYTGTIILLFVLSNLIFNDKLLSIVICIVYGFSVGAISYTIFIRMYMMVTFFIVTTTYLHGLLIENNGRNNSILYISIIIVNILGFLTQYLFIIFASFIAFGYIFYLLKINKWKDIMFYIFGMIAFLVVSIILFPECISHIFFENMGTDVIKNFSTINYLLITRFMMFILKFSKSLFIFPLTILIVFSKKIFCMINLNNRKLSNINSCYSNLSDIKKIIFKIIFYATILSFFMIVKISPYIEVRYLAYLIPNISLISVFFAYSNLLILFNDRKNVLKLLTSIISICYIFSYIFGHIEYTYTNRSNNLEAILSKYYSYKAYCISTEISYNTAVIPLILGHNRSQYITDINDINRIINSDTIEDYVVLYFPSWNDDERISDINVLEGIIENSGYNSYKQLVKKEDSGGVYASIYLLE